MDTPKTPTITLKSPAELRPHPLKRSMPRPADWQRGGSDCNALCDSIADHGVMVPIVIDPSGHILDGESRWLAARQMDLPEVPVTVTALAPATVILAGLIQRKHLSKSALAYTAFPLMADAYAESKAARLENLRKGQCSPEKLLSIRSGNSTEELAEKMGVSRAMFVFAARLHTTFSKRPELRAEFEPQILSGEIGLGAALAGIAGKDATEGKSRKVAEQFELFSAGLGTLETRYAYWASFDAAEKARAAEVIRETVAAMPEDLRDEFERAIRAARKTRPAEAAA